MWLGGACLIQVTLPYPLAAQEVGVALQEVGVALQEVGVVLQEVGVALREVGVVLREVGEHSQGEGEGVVVLQLLLLEACQSQEGLGHHHRTNP